MEAIKEKITPGTIARTICLALALVNQFLLMFDIQAIPITDEQINLVVSTMWTISSSILAWWNNNSFTQSAIRADRERLDGRKAA